MNGYMMYEVAKQRMAEQHRAAEQRQAARQAADARKGRANGRGRRGRPETTVAPVIPDSADELLAAMARDAVPAPRREATRGRHTRSSN
jgi:hypothetical protein